MARLTPAGNPTGRFPAEQDAALDCVFAAAAPLTPGEVDALIWALGELDTYFQISFLVAEDLTASDLSLKFHAIASAADGLLQKLGITEVMSKQIRSGLEYFAKQDAMKNAGGFPNHPPKIIPISFTEEDSFTRFYEDRQLQQNIEGIFQIREWARQAEEQAKLASKREGKASKCDGKALNETARATQELARSGMKEGPELDICEEIFEIWAGILGKPLGTSTRSSDGEPSGPLIKFTTSCLNLIGLKGLSGHAIRQRARRYRACRYKVKPDFDKI